MVAPTPQPRWRGEAMRYSWLDVATWLLALIVLVPLFVQLFQVVYRAVATGH